MSVEEPTCGNCESLRAADCMGMYIFGCGETGLIVPHHADATTKEVMFWRVPENCPLAEGVKKSDVKAPVDEWVIRNFSDFESSER